MRDNKSYWYNTIEDFMTAAGQVVNEKPNQLDRTTAVLRAQLIMEEALETCEALGVTVVLGHSEVNMDILEFDPTHPQHTIATIDGCCDLMYVTIGTLVSMGIPDNPFMNEVCENNLSKVRPTVRIVNGKVQKPPGYQPPRIGMLLDQLLDEHLEK